MKITVISGTNRSNSVSIKVARNLQTRYQKAGVSDVEVLDLSTLPLELFSPDAYSTKPAAFEPFSQRILESDGLVVIAPEYNGSYAGALKLFIDMLKFPESFENRPVAYVGIAAGIWGGLRPVEHLQQVFGYRNALNFNERVFIPAVGKAFDEDRGSFTPPLIEELLEQQTVRFIDFVRRLKGVE